MLWLSSGKRIDGLWVGTYFQTNAGAVMLRIEEALRLIKVHDRRRYERLGKDLTRVWVRLVPGAVARYVPTMETCELDERFVLAETSSADLIAAAIVHEATHARLWRRGIGYDEMLRARVEAACFRRELAFAAKLPNGERVSEQARAALAIPPAAWTDTAERDRDVDGATEVLHHLGAPNWLVRALLAARAWRTSRRATRRSSGRAGMRRPPSPWPSSPKTPTCATTGCVPANGRSASPWHETDSHSGEACERVGTSTPASEARLGHAPCGPSRRTSKHHSLSRKSQGKPAKIRTVISNCIDTC